MSESIDQSFMRLALAKAKRAEQFLEVPIGAVAVLDNEIIGEGFNSPISLNDPIAHAEILALRAAAKRIKNYRLVDVTIYVTLEPCVMCFGAMMHARIKRLVYGASDERFGAISANHLTQFNHSIEIRSGILKKECTVLLQNFFKSRR